MRRAACALLFLAACCAAQIAPIRALIFSGRNNHDWRTTTPFLRTILLDSGRFDVRVIEEPAGTTAATLAGYDVLVLDYNGPRWGEATETAVEAFVRSGKGLVAVHAATYAFGGLAVLGDRSVRTNIIEPPWPAYAEMVGGAWSEAAPRTGHGLRHSFSVKFIDREHPVARGLKETFAANDELYHSIRTQPNIHVLATAFDDPKMKGTGKDEPMLWTVGYGKGRVFHTALGHDVAAMQESGFMITFARGAEWAATGSVTLPASIEPKRAAKPIRVQVVTGGHDHEASFYSVFEGDDRLSVNINPHPIAYRNDLQKRFDVLVLYDMVQEVPDVQRKSLREFLESGKGLVVLHHAIANFNSWSWWTDEVVGGKYLLKPEGNMPASTYKHDEELFVEPVLQHPITKGIPPMHIWDETYKGMWISPKVKVLLRTNNPTSDGPVAWISPYDKSRVVYIELGHDHMAHQHPVYRTLVKQAIFWAAGRE